jgi:hypothetical protein
MKAIFIPFKNQFDRDLENQKTFVYYIKFFNEEEEFIKI